MKQVFSNIKNSLVTLLEDSHCVYFSRGDTIFKEGSPVKHIYFLKKGLVKIVKEMPDEEFIISLVRENLFFGLSSCYSTNIFRFSAYSINDSEVHYIEIEKFRNLTRSDGMFAEAFIEIGLQIEMEIIERMVSLNVKQLPGKLADTLLFFSNIIFKNLTYELPLNRQEMASYMGVSLKSLNKTLREFDKDGIISLANNQIAINRKDILEKLSQKG